MCWWWWKKKFIYANFSFCLVIATTAKPSKEIETKARIVVLVCVSARAYLFCPQKIHLRVKQPHHCHLFVCIFHFIELIIQSKWIDEVEEYQSWIHNYEWWEDDALEGVEDK